MSATQPPGLDQLHDIVLPTVVSWWPPAPMTWVVAAAVLAWAAAGTLALLRIYRRNAYRRAARRRLDEIRPRLRAAETRAAALRDVTVLLKQTALAAFPRDRVAILSGEPWLQFLAETSGEADFVGEPGRILVATAYDPRAAVDAADSTRIANLCARWIANHRHEPPPPSPQALKPPSP